MSDDAQLVVVHLSDCFCLTQPSLYVSNVLLALRAMLQMDLPHVNVLTKIDRVSSYEPLPFNLDFYTEVQDMSHLIPALESESPALRSEKFGRLSRAVVDLVEQFGLVSFEVLAVENKKSMLPLLRVLDRASGYGVGAAAGATATIWQVSMRNESSLIGGSVDVQERWIDSKEAYDEAERQEEERQAQIREAQAQAELDAVGGNAGAPDQAPSSGIRVVRKKK